jgi:hypothetical protein
VRGHVVESGIGESSFGQVREMLTGSVDVRDGPAVEPFVQQLLAGLVERAISPHVVGDDYPSTVAQQPSSFLVEGGLAGRVTQALHRPHDVETPVREGRRGKVGLFEVDAVGQPPLGGVTPRHRDLPGWQRDPDDVDAALLRQPQAAAADTAAGIQDPLAGLDLHPLRQHPIHVL